MSLENMSPNEANDSSESFGLSLDLQFGFPEAQA